MAPYQSLALCGRAAGEKGQTIGFRRRDAMSAPGPGDSDVPSQVLKARLIALLLPCWLEGLGDGSCRGEGGT